MAKPEKRGDGWRVRIRKRGIYESQTFTTKAAAERWLKAKETEIEEGRFVPTAREAERITLKQALDRYLSEVTPTKKGAKQEEYRIRQWQAEEIAKKPFSRVTSDDVVQWRNRRQAEGKAPSTIANAMNLLSALYRHAAAEWQMQGLLNPVIGVRRPPARPGRNARLNADGEAALIAACKDSQSPWLPYIVRLAIETGMRAGELRSLRWQDISGRVARVEEHKTRGVTNEARHVPLSTRALAVIAEIKEALPRQIDGHLFGCTKDQLSQAFSKAANRAKMPSLTFHDLRHIAATRLSKKLPNTMELSAVTGHKTLQVLKRYYNPDFNELAEKLD